MLGNRAKITALQMSAFPAVYSFLLSDQVIYELMPAPLLSQHHIVLVCAAVCLSKVGKEACVYSQEVA
jgi:hypothetical protein